mgnify:CR=1 FL=1
MTPLQPVIISVTMTSGALSSTVAEVPMPHKRIYLQIPTMASGSLYVMAAVASGSTFFRVTEKDPNQATDFVINSAVTNRIVPIPEGFQFYKIESTSGATDVVSTLKVICH